MMMMMMMTMMSRTTPLRGRDRWGVFNSIILKRPQCFSLSNFLRDLQIPLGLNLSLALAVGVFGMAEDTEQVFALL
jgi:hypothetical protein